MADPAQTGFDALLAAVADRVRAHAPSPFLLGIGGPPASGKSTLAQRIARSATGAHGLTACYCPMDGFHLPNARLEALGLRAVKGRIDTFDGDALLLAMQKLCAGQGAFWWPGYSRELHDPVTEGTRITGEEDLCVIEGNYILADAPIWTKIAGMFDFSIFLDAPDRELRLRLMKRHLSGGITGDSAERKIAETDMPNAQEIRRQAARADLVCDVTIGLDPATAAGRGEIGAAGCGPWLPR